MEIISIIDMITLGLVGSLFGVLIKFAYTLGKLKAKCDRIDVLECKLDSLLEHNGIDPKETEKEKSKR